MKLDVVAVDHVAGTDSEIVAQVVAVTERPSRRSTWVGGRLFAGLLCMMWTGSALALDGIDLSQPAEETASGECP